MSKVMIWTMNAAENLLLEDDLELNKIFGIGGWEFGNRFPFESGKPDAKRIRHNLLPDAEYFVPMAVKCCGNYFGQNIPEIMKVRNHYTEGGLQDYTHFWSDDDGPSGMSKMITKPYLGYYEILEASGNDKNILVGYSQGGLAALYLSWLDRKVFKKNIIHGIVSVSSPNFGSPLANDKNKTAVTDGFLKILMNFISLDERNFSALFSFLQTGFHFESIIKVFDYLVAGAESIQASQKTKDSFRAFFDSLKKWAGGLSEDKNNAFFDLDIRQVANPGSVLNTVANEITPDVFRGAVISANSDFHAIVHSFLKENIFWLIRPFVNLFIDNLKILEKPMPANMNSISSIFCNEMMLENLSQTDLSIPVIRELQEKYRNGYPEWHIKKESHDFVVPSAYQILPGPLDPRHLGCFVNAKANHNSGKALHFKGGRENRRLILKILKKMA